MPKQIDEKAPLSETRLEIIFTRAALKAHPHTGDLVSITDDWHLPLAGLQIQMDTNEEERVTLDAHFKILNAGFDVECKAFSEIALKAADGDRTDPRYTRYFPIAPSEFVRQDIDDQVKAVQGWLTVDDPILTDDLRKVFKGWITALTTHSAARVATNQKTITLQIARRAFAAELTEKRDDLARRLGDRGKERKQPRGFSALFFRKG